MASYSAHHPTDIAIAANRDRFVVNISWPTRQIETKTKVPPRSKAPFNCQLCWPPNSPLGQRSLHNLSHTSLTPQVPAALHLHTITKPAGLNHPSRPAITAPTRFEKR